MNNGAFSVPLSSRDEAVRQLLEDLVEIGVHNRPALDADWDLLSIMVEDARDGVNIRKRHPSFYRSLLNDAELRQAFLDALESLEIEAGSDEAAFSRLFAAGRLPRDGFLSQSVRTYQLTFERTIAQLQAVFFPPRLAYRAGMGLFEEPLLVLLREEIEIECGVYAVALRCTPSADDDEALSLFMDVAVTPLSVVSSQPFPVQFELMWGVYHATVPVLQEGRVRFPDIFYREIFAEDGQSIKVGLTLNLETGAS